MNKLLGIGVLSAALVFQAEAVQITGQIDMAGTATLNNALLGSATGASSFSGVIVLPTADGDYSGTALSPVTFSPFNWNPSSAPVTPLWTFTSGVLTYSFDLSTLSIVTQNNTFLNLSGTGILSITGPGSSFDPTPGDWSFSITQAGGAANPNLRFGFLSSNDSTSASVPDGGATLALLGSAMVAAGFLRRRLS